MSEFKAAFNWSRIRGTKPVNDDGTLANYAKIPQVVATYGPMSKREILLMIGKPTRPGYYSGYFGFLIDSDLLRYNRKNNVYELGNAYADWHRRYVGPQLFNYNREVAYKK